MSRSHLVSRCAGLGLGALAVAGCSFSSGNQVGAVDASVEPDAIVGQDADTPRASHLLLSEVKATVIGEEFVEILNLTGAPVDLADYYLADSAEYALLPGRFGGGPMPEINEADFLVGFPSGASIGAGEVAVVALDGQSFAGAFGRDPTFSIDGTAGKTTVPAYDGAVGPFVSITDGGEAIALLYWDGESDLVRDVDLVQTGAGATEANLLVDKGELSVDGPDTGNATTSYASDALTLGEMSESAGGDESYQRAAVETDHETRGGDGNGLEGHDETSEDLQATWVTTGPPTPGAAPTLR